MTYLISTIIFAVVGSAQLNIFEIEGIFSSAHVSALEDHIDQNEYNDDDLLILQYSSTRVIPLECENTLFIFPMSIFQ